ncbi:MAG TPA: DUF3006 domain-containing protein [Blastocatellia bacterium]|nr:DUF3006 domain-containing protein [Blastocatellia bacterium]
MTLSHKLVVDRIEGELAVLLVYDDDRIRINVPLSLLPEGTREGDHLNVQFSRDEEGRRLEEDRVTRLMRELKSRNS